MTRFVTIIDVVGVAHLVNPDQVAHVSPRRSGGARVVFGIAAGGFHEIAVDLEPAAIARTLAMAPGGLSRPSQPRAKRPSMT